MTKAMLMVHDTDPAQAIWKAVGDLSKIEVFGNRVLLGIYERPEKTKGGLFLTETTRQEDMHQGKSALVLKMGKSAFISDANYNFGTDKIAVGDWVSIWVSDGRRVAINGKICRVIEDHHIALKIPSPDCVY